jgi:hypothetical protein
MIENFIILGKVMNDSGRHDLTTFPIAVRSKLHRINATELAEKGKLQNSRKVHRL